jgi:hypothetical protein
VMYWVMPEEGELFKVRAHQLNPAALKARL